MSINISGLVGLTVLLNKKNNKLIVLLADIHDGVKYCEKNNIYIDDLLNKLLDNQNINVMLEEVPREGINLIELWPNAKHTQRLKDWYLKNTDKIVPIDIRPYLVPFSYQKYFINDLDDNEKNMKMINYLQTLDSIFSLNDKPLDNGLFFINNLVNGLKNKESGSGINMMYKLIKEKYIKLRYIKDLNNSFEQIIKNDVDWFKELEELKINLMDWYTTILLLGGKHSICHFGLAHFMNVKAILINNFYCELIYEDGINKISKEILDDDKILACMKLIF